MLAMGGAAEATSPKLWPDLGGKLVGQADSPGDSAVIVSIERYFALPAVEGAHRNGRDWYQYLTASRGLAPGRVAWLSDADATGEEIEAAVKKAARQTKAGGRVWFVYIGHGAPSQNGKDGLLVPVDAQAKVTSLEKRGLPQTRLLNWLSSGRGKPIVLIDSCFSGRSSTGKPLVKGLQPTVVPRASVPSRATVLTAAGASQFAGPLPGEPRPAFSYLVLGGLRGWADADGDKKVTPSELLAYTNGTLSVLLQGRRNQTAELAGGGKKRTLAKAQESGPKLAKLVLGLSDVGYGESTKCREGFRHQKGRGCVPLEVRDCKPGFAFVDGRGCVALQPGGSAGGSRIRKKKLSKVAKLGPSLRRIPGGAFMMGAPRGDEAPVHRVKVPTFWLDETEVTVGQYKRCVTVGSCRTPRVDERSPWDKGLNGLSSSKRTLPVNGVSWGDAKAFCAWTGKRLPREEEWEYAARGRAGRKYPWGYADPSRELLNSLDQSGQVWLQTTMKRRYFVMAPGSDGFSTTAPAGIYPLGKTPEGVLDMAGNVWEWTSSSYCPYRKSGTNRCAAHSKVARGGSWASNVAQHVESSNRAQFDPASRFSYLGFRCALSQ